MDFEAIKAGINIPDDFFVVVEISQGATPVKYEYNKQLGGITVDRFVATTMFYPTNYGFIPHTLAGDGDPLDALVVTPYPVAVGSVIRARALGVLIMEDDGGMDEKIISVAHQKLTPLYDNTKSCDDLPQQLLDQIEHYFKRYKELEPGKWVKISGWKSLDVAHKLIAQAVANYKE